MSAFDPKRTLGSQSVSLRNVGAHAATRVHQINWRFSSKACPLAAYAQQRSGNIARIGFLTRKTDASVSSQIDAFRQGLHDLGWVEGKNIGIEYRDADGQVDRLRPLAAELVALNVDVIVTVDTPPTQAAKQATSTIPIVIAVSADPVGAGLVKSLGHPGGNATGLSLLAPETDQKTLEVLKDTLPKTKRVAMIFDPKNQGMMIRLKAIEIAATKARNRASINTSAQLKRTCHRVDSRGQEPS